MTDTNIPVTEDELHAFVDGELPAERRAAVEAWIATHPADAEKLKAWRAMSDMRFGKGSSAEITGFHIVRRSESLTDSAELAEKKAPDSGFSEHGPVRME